MQIFKSPPTSSMDMLITVTLFKVLETCFFICYDFQSIPPTAYRETGGGCMDGMNISLIYVSHQYNQGVNSRI